MNKVTERAIEYMIRPIKSYTGNGLLEQTRRVDEFQLSLFFLKFLKFLLCEYGNEKHYSNTSPTKTASPTTPHKHSFFYRTATKVSKLWRRKKSRQPEYTTCITTGMGGVSVLRSIRHSQSFLRPAENGAQQIRSHGHCAIEM